MRIRCEFVYDAAHYLPYVRKTHKCGRLHGHTYVLTVFIDGDLDEHGWVMDFAEVKEQVYPWLSRLDHHVLNHEIDNPTVEVQLHWWWDKLVRSIPGLAELWLQEGRANAAIYRGE